MILSENERLDEVNEKLKLIQKTDGLVFGTDALLLAAYAEGEAETAVEYGAGTGIVSLLLATRKKAKHITAVEVQSEFADLAGRNIELNGLSDKVTAVCADVRDWRAETPVAMIVSNPPYMKTDSGFSCDKEKKNVARHEVMGDIGEFLAAAKRNLKYGGAFLAVYRPDRLCDLLNAMRKAEIEPKRMTFVHASAGTESSMVLVEGKRGGKCGLFLTPPLLLYRDGTHRENSAELNYILENGSFPPAYSVKRRKCGSHGK